MEGVVKRERAVSAYTHHRVTEWDHISDFCHLHRLWSASSGHHCTPRRCIAIECTAIRITGADHVCTACEKKKTNSIQEILASEGGSQEYNIAHMLNTRTKVISFDNGKCELNDNWIFFWLSIWPSLNHLAFFCIILSYFSSMDPSYGTGFLRDNKRINGKFENENLWIEFSVGWANSLRHNFVKFANQRLQTIPEYVVFAILDHQLYQHLTILQTLKAFTIKMEKGRKKKLAIYWVLLQFCCLCVMSMHGKAGNEIWINLWLEFIINRRVHNYRTELDPVSSFIYLFWSTVNTLRRERIAFVFVWRSISGGSVHISISHRDTKSNTKILRNWRNRNACTNLLLSILLIVCIVVFVVVSGGCRFSPQVIVAIVAVTLLMIRLDAACRRWCWWRHWFSCSRTTNYLISVGQFTTCRTTVTFRWIAICAVFRFAYVAPCANRRNRNTVLIVGIHQQSFQFNNCAKRWFVVRYCTGIRTPHIFGAYRRQVCRCFAFFSILHVRHDAFTHMEFSHGATNYRA